MPAGAVGVTVIVVVTGAVGDAFGGAVGVGITRVAVGRGRGVLVGGGTGVSVGGTLVGVSAAVGVVVGVSVGATVVVSVGVSVGVTVGVEVSVTGPTVESTPANPGVPDGPAVGVL
ncbi:MAG TPA: hypothetical protein VFZ25_00530 [Chloroflexota bacterium]|nr:hypothetical protein [Chloroflexota bacterium]